jgi:hypothetical protein
MCSGWERSADGASCPLLAFALLSPLSHVWRQAVSLCRAVCPLRLCDRALSSPAPSVRPPTSTLSLVRSPASSPPSARLNPCLQATRASPRARTDPRLRSRACVSPSPVPSVPNLIPYSWTGYRSANTALWRQGPVGPHRAQKSRDAPRRR